MGKGHYEIKTANMARPKKKKEHAVWFALFSMIFKLLDGKKNFPFASGQKVRSNRYNLKS